MSCLKVEHALAWLDILDSSDLFAWVQQMQSVSDQGFKARSVDRPAFLACQNALLCNSAYFKRLLPCYLSDLFPCIETALVL